MQLFAEVLRWLTLFVSLSVATEAVGQEQSSLAVRIRSDQGEYVFAEPIKVAVSIVNTGDRTARIPLVEDFSSLTMWFTHYEVTGPDRAIQSVRHIRVRQNRIWNFETRGGPLAPGDSISFFCYPNLVNRTVGARGENIDSFAPKSAFNESGTYSIRFVYSMSSEFTQLSQGIWRSNELPIAVVAADAEDARILAAMWRAMPEGESGVDYTRVDLDSLSRAIKEAPDNAMTKHAIFALARAYYNESFRRRDMAARASELLNGLMKSAADFRYEEVRLFLARSLIVLGRPGEAANVLLALMEERPALWSNYRFVEAATIPGITRNGFTVKWQERERTAGAVPMTRDEVFAAGGAP
jgi:hypothetical protein